MERLHVRIPLHGGTTLDASLFTPRLARGAVIVATSGGDGAFPARDRQLASVLEQLHLATMVIDLVAGEPVPISAGLLAQRLVHATEWMRHQHPGLRVGYVGIGTAATAALVAAAQHPESAAAVVAWSPRPQQAGAWLDTLTAPVLLLAGERDADAVEQCREALPHLPAFCQSHVVENATGDFHTPAVVADAVQRTASWLTTTWLGGRIGTERP